jgi:pimeloyl-ACP methyl ester carboxylesterase
MSRIVLIHGIGQQIKGPQTILADWYPALCDGLALAGGELDQADASVAFYGDIFRRSGGRSLGDPILDASDVTDAWDAELLQAWWQEAARLETAVIGPDDPGRIRTPYSIQRALDALSHSAFFAGCSEHLMISSARQVRLYLTETRTRQAVRARVTSCVTQDTRVIVAHSLGSVVAYEALCANPGWSGMSFVTLGSPLGIRRLVFDRLEPSPAGGRGNWPQSATRWTNIADRGDVVALAKKLAPLFGDRVTDVPVHNGAKAHDAKSYLTAKETGQAIAEGLS